MQALGILILFIIRKPVSLPTSPNFGPKSPVSIPGKCLWFSSLNYTMNACNPKN